MTIPRRGEIYLVQFDPDRLSEIQKTRPALVIQNDIGNRYSPIAIVAAITSKISPIPYPVEVSVSGTKSNGLSQASAVQLNQIRSADKQRLVKRMGVLDPTTMKKVDAAMMISLGLTKL